LLAFKIFSSLAILAILTGKEIDLELDVKQHAVLKVVFGIEVFDEITVVLTVKVGNSALFLYSTVFSSKTLDAEDR
jgi:hypothetical protein